MITPPRKKAGELSNGGLAIGRASGNNEDRVVVADAVMGCNVLEWAGRGDTDFYFRGGAEHLEGSEKQLLLLEQAGSVSCQRRWRSPGGTVAGGSGGSGRGAWEGRGRGT